MNRRDSLSPSARALLASFVAAVSEARPRVRAALASALRSGVREAKLREAMRMVHLFGGFPRTLTALESLRDALAARRRVAVATDRVRAAAGRATFERIYGRNVAAVRAWLRMLDPDVARWIEEHAYARVLSRPGLSPVERELLAVAALAVSRQERQLVSHVLGARRFGATIAQVRGAFRVGARSLSGKDRARLARRLADALASA